MIFDTLKIYQTLREEDTFSEGQAMRLVEVFREMFVCHAPNGEVARLGTEKYGMRTEMVDVKAEFAAFRRDLRAIEGNLTWKIGAMFAIGVN